MRITALLTGRGNSALANKNILPVLGKPLLSYPALAAKHSKFIDSFYVSSDDNRILEIAGKIGYKQIKRPKYLSGPNSQHGDVIRQALNEIKKYYKFTPDILIVLLANSATIKTSWIDSCIQEIMKNSKISAVVPVCLDLDHHPYRAKKLNKKGFLEPFFDFKEKKISTNRQDLVPSYFLCHNFWVLNVRNSIFSVSGQQPWSFMGKNIKSKVLNSCCDVHVKEDLIKTENWLRENLK